MTDGEMLGLVERADSHLNDGAGGYVNVYVLNGRLVVRFEDAVTHEVSVSKWSLTKVDE